MNQYQKLITNLTKLNLNNMAASIVDYRQPVNDHQIIFSEALLELTNKELAYQQEESLKRRIKRARFPVVKTLGEFKYEFQPSIKRQQIEEFATMSFLDNQENIIFIGSPGVGKTHLSIGLGVEACKQGVRTLFINCHELILRLTAAQEKQHLERVMRRYERYDLLVIDELGYLPIAANEANLLFQLINGRYERKSTIITTNVPLSSWGTVLHNQAAAEAILDRLVYHSHVIKIKGKSYRLASANS
ncbi:IS21-like element helper ATPase IstB [Limosilactobacillus sp.]|uniref:IS21-like element helper ATPase IstB n=1 Tax=Limosilactobacillus sp. TaxID=2773925 RepID=UPI00345EF66E